MSREQVHVNEILSDFNIGLRNISSFINHHKRMISDRNRVLNKSFKKVNNILPKLSNRGKRDALVRILYNIFETSLHVKYIIKLYELMLNANITPDLLPSYAALRDYKIQVNNEIPNPMIAPEEQLDDTIVPNEDPEIEEELQEARTNYYLFMDRYIKYLKSRRLCTRQLVEETSEKLTEFGVPPEIINLVTSYIEPQVTTYNLDLTGADDASGDFGFRRSVRKPRRSYKNRRRSRSR